MARREPYTQIGISRIPCARCGQKSRYQWQICALNNLWHGLCSKCDVELNAMVLDFMRVPNAAELAAAYRAKVESQE